MTEMSAAPDIGPNLRQLPAARHIGCPVVGTLDLFLGNMGEHQVDDLAIMLFALPFRPFVHNGRESGSETVRHVTTVIARAIEQIANRVLAHGPMRVSIAGEEKGARARKRPYRAQDGDEMGRATGGE